MFAFSIIIAIVIGYLFKGKLQNIRELNLKGQWFIVIGFLLEIVMKILLKKGIIEIGSLTYIINVIMYGLIMTFIFLNRKEKLFLIVGLGFLLNIIVIFANNCTMPIGLEAMKYLNFSGDVEKLGLYALVDSNTRFVILADIIPYKIWRYAGIASLGDILICIGIIGITVKTMINKPLVKEKI